mmetsp:Transcript_84008/g.102905  ORF Transcript_84008/g.102905 Transcript_84008/m.102905 type:complete len:135 (-) Transcript_84008:3-407(-)
MSSLSVTQDINGIGYEQQITFKNGESYKLYYKDNNDTDKPIYIGGYMEKQSKHLKIWHKRYVLMDLFGYRLYTFKSDKDIMNHRATTSMTIGFITEIKIDDNINNDGFYTFNVQTNVSFLEEHDIDVNSLLFMV